MTGVDFREVTKRYGDATALAGVSLRFDPGAVHCLVGPNGAGKSTLFDLALGLTTPTAGGVTADVRPGAAFQQPNFYPDLTVGENCRVFASMADADDDAWLATLRESFGLGDVWGRRAGRVSGGYMRKLDLALAFVRRPPLVLLDEPLSDLDDASQARLLAFLREYRDDGGGVVVATHRVAAFEGLAERVTVLEGGQVVWDGPAEDVEGSIEEHYLDIVLGAAPRAGGPNRGDSPRDCGPKRDGGPSQGNSRS